MTKAQTKLTRSESKNLKNWLLKPRTILLLIALAVLAIPAFLFFRYDMTVNRSLSDTLKDASKVLSSLSATGQAVYSVIDDQGCDSRNSVGLAHYVHCEVQVQRIYRHNDNLPEELAKVNAQLNTAGFDLQSGPAALDGKTRAQLMYTSETDPRTRIDVSFFRTETDANDYRIAPLVKEKSIEQPSVPDYLYGVTVISTYYACNDSPWGIKCPSPPSDKRAN